MALFSKLLREKKINIEEDTALLGDYMPFEAREAYKLLRTNLMFTLPPEKKCKVIGVTSSIRSEGKSTTSINLAYSLSQDDKKVLLIDGDLRLPSLKAKLKVNESLGLADMIVGNVTGKKKIIVNVSNNLDLLLSGSIPPNPSELLGSKKCKEIIEKLQESYDYIVLDLPPVNIVSDALVTKDIVDGVIVIVRENGSYKRSLNECIDSLNFIGMNILGLVLTNSEGGPSHYGVNRYSYKYGKKKYSYYYRRRGYNYYNYYHRGYKDYGDANKQNEGE